MTDATTPPIEAKAEVGFVLTNARISATVALMTDAKFDGGITLTMVEVFAAPPRVSIAMATTLTTKPDGCP